MDGEERPTLVALLPHSAFTIVQPDKMNYSLTVIAINRYAVSNRQELPSTITVAFTQVFDTPLETRARQYKRGS